MMTLPNSVKTSLSGKINCSYNRLFKMPSHFFFSHGLDAFYSCFGIYRAVQYFWEKGYRNIIVCVKNLRKNSINTVYGQSSHYPVTFVYLIYFKRRLVLMSFFFFVSQVLNISKIWTREALCLGLPAQLMMTSECISRVRYASLQPTFEYDQH